MAELLMMKGASGSLLPASTAAQEWLSRKKIGATLLIDAREPRNYRFHSKWFALVTLAFDHWQEFAQTLEYKGEPVRPEFERFRKDVTISAGFYYPVVNLKGEVRIEPESLKWASMSEERFTQLYDATINVLLRRVFNGKVCPTWTEQELRHVAEQILEFAA